MAKGDPSGGNAGNAYFPSLYQNTVNQTAEDYDSIMSQYQNLGNTLQAQSASGANNQYQFSPINPTFITPEASANYGYLEDFARTGGYSDSDISNIRERAVSPVRSIYSSAQRDLARQKNLSGGYAPNFAAASAKMAREQSGIIGDRVTDANARIAEAVQQGKLAGATSLSNLRARDVEMRNNINSQNANIANQIAELNAKYGMASSQMKQQSDNSNFDNILETIKGQHSLFGTTPGNMSTIGNQVLSAANLANNFAPINKGNANLPRPGQLGAPGGYNPFNPRPTVNMTTGPRLGRV